MELSPSSSTPVVTLIEKLPAELIERILLEVTTHVVSPDINGAKPSSVDHGSPSSDTYTILSTVDYSSPRSDEYNVPDIVSNGAPAPLDFRLTCSTFRSLSWRAFAAELGKTRFDLRSRQSFSNLVAVASCKYLAPWITKLTLACHGTPEKYPYAYCDESVSSTMKLMDKGLFHELLRVKQDEHTWYPGIWERWPETILDIPSRCVPLERYQRVDIRLLEKTLASALQSFCNLNHLCYVHEPEVRPGRYYKCSQPQGRHYDYQSSFDFLFGSGYYAGYIAHVGLEILIRAMASSGIAVRTMELAVDLDEHHAFITNVPTDLFEKVCQKVENLTLSDSYCPFFDSDDARNESRVSITSTIFPSLRHLVIDHKGTAPDFDNLVTPYPPPSNIPSLVSLSIASARLDHATLLSFVQSYGKNARKIMFKNMMYPDFRNLLEVIREFDLEELRIHHDPGQFHGDRYHYKMCEGIPELVQKAARTVVISPIDLKDLLEQKWKLARASI